MGMGIGMEHRINSRFLLKGMMKFIQGTTENKGLNHGNNDVDILTGAVSVGYNIWKSTELIVLFSYVHGSEKEIDSVNLSTKPLHCQIQGKAPQFSALNPQSRPIPIQRHYD